MVVSDRRSPRLVRDLRAGTLPVSFWGALQPGVQTALPRAGLPRQRMDSANTQVMEHDADESGVSARRPVTSPTRDAVAAEGRRGDAWLTAAAWFWVVVTVVGQLLFASYITVLYGGGAIRGDITVLDRVMPKGHVPGDPVGNATIIVHLFLALVIMLAGAMQLVPQIRKRAPWLHRWTGRSYITAALLASFGGLYLVWVRGTVGDFAQHLGSTLNGSLIVLCGVLAWRSARARHFVAHRKWALRLFLVASGVWFFRVGLMFTLLIFQRPVGFDPKTFTGPFLTFLTFAESLFPLLVLEGYFWGQERATERGRMTVAVCLGLLTVAMAVGVFGAMMGMWLPRMR